MSACNHFPSVLRLATARSWRGSPTQYIFGQIERYLRNYVKIVFHIFRQIERRGQNVAQQMYRGKIDRARRCETTAILEIYKWTPLSPFDQLLFAKKSEQIQNFPPLKKRSGFISGVAFPSQRFSMCGEKERGKG